jgi:GT2 family glycosyltransferase
MIYTHITYAPADIGENIGKAYNMFMEMLPDDDDWACFLDHDAMFTTSDWYHQLNDIIKENPTLGAFGARTNRLNSTYQLVGNIDVYSHDIKYHREIGKHLQREHYNSLFRIDDNTAQIGFSGVLILLKKSTWKKINGFKPEGFNHVDNDLRYRLEEHNIPFHIMNGVYVYHWYKADDPYERCREKF